MLSDYFESLEHTVERNYKKNQDVLYLDKGIENLQLLSAGDPGAGFHI
jgi:hypothetical protein